MFQFANLLLLALFAAALFDVVCAWRLTPQGPGRARRALGLLWQQEHFLFGQWGAGWRQKAGLWVFCAGLGIYEVTYCLFNNTLRFRYLWLETVVFPLGELAALACFAAKLLLFSRYSWKDLAFAGGFYFIARWVFFNCHYAYFLIFVCAILAFKDLPPEKPLYIFLLTGAVSVTATVLASVFGLLPEVTEFLRGESVRMTFGYDHPNVLGGNLLGLCIAWLLVRAKKLRWVDLCVPVLAAAFLVLGPSSRTAALCLLLLAGALAVYKLRPTLFGSAWVQYGGVAVVPVLAASSYLLPLGVDSSGVVGEQLSPVWLAQADSLLSGRIYYSWQAYQQLGLRIAGQPLTEDLILDNSFVRALYLLGPVMTLLLFALVAVTLLGLARKGAYVSFLALTVMTFYAFCEQQWFRLASNPTLLLLCGAVYLLPLARWPAAEGEPPAA